MSKKESIVHLIEKLNLHRVDESQKIIQQIIAYGDDAIEPLFEAFYHDEKTGEKEYILDALINLIDHDRLVEHLIRIMHCIHGFTRYYSLKHLLEFGNETIHHQLIPFIIESIGGHYYLDKLARDHLPHLGEPALNQLIVAIDRQSQLQNTNRDDRLCELVFILVSFNDEKILKPAINALKSVQNEGMYQSFIWAFKKVSAKVVSDLIEILKDSKSSYSLKLCIVHILANVRDKQSALSLLPLLNHSNEEMRSFVAYAFGDIGNRAVIPNLIELLKTDPHIYVRMASANALGEMRDDTAIQPLIESLQADKSSEVRRMAVSSLRHYKGVDVVTALIQALRDEETDIAVMAGYALRNQFDDARSHLQALHKEEPELIERAFNTMKWEFINLCRNDEELQKSSLSDVEGISSIIDYYNDQSHNCPICGKSPTELTWFYISSSPESWRMLVGRAGWQSVCDDCKIQVNFFLTTMN